ncbi:hypothetical protein FRC11_013111 [Ceratobasidium sp. 423]|nr:hypothetical protein FRC11_013111 [Ceratobasidium sp. 423]
MNSKSQKSDKRSKHAHKSSEGAGKSTSSKGKAHKSREDEGSVGSDSDSNLGEQAEEEWEDMEDESEDGDKGSQTGKKEAKTGRKPHGKTSDFTGVVKKMVDYTTIRVCAKLATEGMFLAPAQYRSLVSKCWDRAAAEYGVDSRKPKYRLEKPQYETVGTAKGKGHFQHDFLQDVMFEAYFTGLSPVGIIYKKWFQHMPLPAIVLVCAIALREYYNETMDSLKAFETGKQGPCCAVVQVEFYVNSMEWAGHPVVQEEIPPADEALHEDDFAEDTLTAEELEMVARLTGKSHSSRKPPNAPSKSNSSISPAKSHTPRSPLPDSNEPATTRSSPAPPRSPRPLPHSSSARSSSACSSPARSSPTRGSPTRSLPTRGSPARSPRPLPRSLPAPSSDSPGIACPQTSTRPASAASQSDHMHRTSRHERCSSVSLDQEGSESEQENAATPTPATRSYSQVTQNHKITTPLDNDEDDSDEEDEGGHSHNKLSSDSEDDAEQSQAPPKEKSKAKKCSTNLMEKLITGSGWKKPSPGTAFAMGKLKLSQGGSSQKSKPRSKLSLQ